MSLSSSRPLGILQQQINIKTSIQQKVEAEPSDKLVSGDGVYPECQHIRRVNHSRINIIFSHGLLAQ